MARPETFTYKTVHECDVKADVYRPPETSVPSRVLVYIHGGCLMYGSRKGIHPRQLETYLNASYTVVSIDYRLAPETKLPYIIEDLQDAFRWVRDEAASTFSMDADRLAVVGHSAGGYLALMVGFCVEPRPKAIVAFYGYGDIVGDWYAKPDPFYSRFPHVSVEESGRDKPGSVISEPYEGRDKDQFYLYCRQRGLWPKEVGGYDPDTEPEFFVPYCPVQNVEPHYPPTMLLHGDHDTDVPYEQSVQMAEVLSRAGIEHEFITVEGGGHGFDGQMDSPHVQNLFQRVVDFLHRHMA